MLAVAYRGAQPALTDMIAGNVDMFFDTLATSVPLHRAGKLKILAVADLQRAKTAPDLPTFTEAGMPGFRSITWFGLVAPPGTPAALAQRINRDAVEMLRSPEVVARLQSLSLEAGATSPAETAKFFAGETALWGKVIKEAGITPQYRTCTSPLRNCARSPPAGSDPTDRMNPPADDRRPSSPVIDRNVVDVAGILRVAAPRIADIVEVVRAEHVAAEPPAVGEALLGHVARADADVVDRADVPAEMMQARPVRLHEGDHVVIAAVDAVHEGDEIAGAIRQPQTEHVAVEIDRPRNVGRRK